jgi:hypothetical protein
MDLTEYRASDSEKKRTEDLLNLIKNISDSGKNALDIGARDGYFSKLLAKYFMHVTALDLEKPSVNHENVTSVKGDATNLSFDDNTFDFVFCAEVLEHIPTHLLEKACSELSRVSSKFVLIGVPYIQDIRIGRTTCFSCGKKNPPWGHVNSFDRRRLMSLFPMFNVKEVSFIGKNNSYTNFISTFLVDLAGNPYGTYDQAEPCVHCGKKLKKPSERNIFQKISTKTAFYVKHLQAPFSKEHSNWIHILFEKQKV